MESVQTVQEENSVKVMVEIYMFTYARKVRDEIEQLTQKHCFGCRNNDPSQRNHSCLMWSEMERLSFYFDDAMERIDCQEVLNLWKNETQLTDISQDLKDIFERLLRSDEWRENHLPSKDRFYDMVKNIMQLNHRFYQ